MDLFGWKNFPLGDDRRKQAVFTAACLVLITVGTLSCYAFLLWGILFSHFLRIPFLLYAVWIYYDFKNPDIATRSSEWVRNWDCWQYFIDYFSIKIVKTVDLPPDRNYILASFPHGILSIGIIGGFSLYPNRFRKLYPGLTQSVMTLNFNLTTPFLRTLYYTLGYIPQKECYLLKRLSIRGQAVCIIPGGAEESFHSKPGEYNIIARKRKGFVRVALQTGSSLVPVLAFGETDLIGQKHWPTGSFMRNFQEKIKKWTGFVPLILIGRGSSKYFYSPMPFRKPVTLVVGAPIHTKKIEKPSKEEIDTIHEVFCDQLQELFDTHKEKYHPNQNVKLTFL